MRDPYDNRMARSLGIAVVAIPLGLWSHTSRVATT